MLWRRPFAFKEEKEEDQIGLAHVSRLLKFGNGSCSFRVSDFSMVNTNLFVSYVVFGEFF